MAGFQYFRDQYLNYGKVNVSEEEKKEGKSFRSLGLCDDICEICEKVGWKEPTDIQREAIPVALIGQDIIGLAETGSGKTGAYALPILQKLLDKKKSMFALILVPTRELAFQVFDAFSVLGQGIQLKICTIVGGLDIDKQRKELMKKPHVIVATPGRLLEHLQSTNGLSLGDVKYLVLDEADKMVDVGQREALKGILPRLSKHRITFMFSATIDSRIKQLQQIALLNPAKIDVSRDNVTVETLSQFVMPIPGHKDDLPKTYCANLYCLATKFKSKSVIVFCKSCHQSALVTTIMKNLGFKAIPLHGNMTQEDRLENLYSFKEEPRGAILIATDVASRGLDIPEVDVVINYELPKFTSTYIHRVGRTARAGRYGTSVTFVNRDNLEDYGRIVEEGIEQKLKVYPPNDKRDLDQAIDRIKTVEMKSRRECISAEKEWKKDHPVSAVYKKMRERKQRMKINKRMKRK